MSDFPKLKTGAVIQYPAGRELRSSVQVLTFVDGSEQRFRDRAGTLRRWVVQLDLLDEQEIRQIEAFFVSQQGRFGNFAFVDPWDGTEYANCSIEADDLSTEFREEARARVQLVVRQNAG